MDRLIECVILSYHTPSTSMYMVRLTKKVQFSLKNAQKLEFSGNTDEVGNPGKKFCSGMDRLIEGIILSYHTPLYLKNCGRAHQVSKSVIPHAAPQCIS